MHPLVKEMWTKAKALGLDLNEVSAHAGVQRQSIKRWVIKGITPKKTGLRKVKALIKKFDTGEIKGPSSSDEPIPVYLIPDHLSEEKKEMYRLIHKMERENKSLANTPEDEESLRELHVHIGVTMENINDDGTQKFSRVKLERLRIEHGLTQRDMSRIAGRSHTWYGNFRQNKSFPETYAKKFAEYFNIPLKDLMVKPG